MFKKVFHAVKSWFVSYLCNVNKMLTTR